MKDLKIIKKEKFNDLECDFYKDEKGEVFITRNQIGKALEYSNPSRAISDIHRANKERLDRFSRCTKISLPSGGVQEVYIYNVKGIYEICRHSNQPKANLFYDFVYDILEEIRKTGEYKNKRHKPIDRAIKQHFNIADTIIQATGIKPGLAYSVAISEAEKETGYKYEEYKKLLPSAEHEVASFNATKLGEMLGGIKAQEVNKRLEKLGLQEKKDKDWRITEEGKKFGEEMPFTRHGHSNYRILWHEKVLEKLKN